MRALLNLALCGVAAIPGAALAQDVSTPLATPALAPLPTVQPTVEAPAPVASKPPPAGVDAAPAPELPPGPTTVVPVLVQKEEKDGVGAKMGTVVGGVVGGLAGAAVAGPVGKFAGGLVGKKLAKGVLGDKDDLPEVTVAEAPLSADAAATPAVASPATAPPIS